MTLDAFLHPVELKQEKEVVISKRFLDGEGKPVPFKIRTISQEENEALSKRSVHLKKVEGRKFEALDDLEYTRRLIVACTAYPDFTNSELCQAYGVMDPLMVPGKMLNSGEYKRLLQAIMEFNDFTSAVDLEEEAKN